jgi:microcystin degradation protein MlrC
MLIAIAGIMHESNTFALQPADRQRFIEGSWTTGNGMLPVWRDAHHEMGGFIEGAERFGYELLPTVMAWATPAGSVTDEVLDEVTDRVVAECRKQTIDGLLVALHGAMVTPRHPSADTEVLRRLREALGPDLPIIATLDFHGNVSPATADYADALVGYQTYPHVDQRQRGLFAAELMTRMVRREVRPVVAVAKPPLIINLLGQATDREPMRRIMAIARRAEQREGMLSVSVMAGFPYADVPDMGPAVIAVHDGDREAASAVAEEIAEAMWSVRDELYVPCPNPAEAVRMAIESAHAPVLLIDLGDNIGGGSAGDGTVLLAELLEQKARGAVVVLYAPPSVTECQRLGVGERFTGKVGGALDRLHGEPVLVSGVVQSLHDGKWVETEARHGGRRHNDQGATAVLTIDGRNTLVLNSLRTPPFSLGQLTSLGIDPTAAHIIVIKAAVAYKAAYAPLGGRIIEVDTPGVTAINTRHFTYRNIRRPMFPLDS